jgi:hypothetical protein
MPRENNFLLGSGDRLTEPVRIRAGGGIKNPPYDFGTARHRVKDMLQRANEMFSQLPAQACPRDQAVAKLTLHPRYISKSDFPKQLLDSVGLRSVGSRPQVVKPERWGIEQHAEMALTEELFVAGSRQAFQNWGRSIERWTDRDPGNTQIAQIERLEPYSANDKLRSIPDRSAESMFEIVLHNAGVPDYMLAAFAQYAQDMGAKPIMARKRHVRGLTFIPVRALPRDARHLAQFSFVRVARGMPVIRPIPNILRVTSAPLRLPDEDVVAPDDVRVSIFDGGLPDTPDIRRWIDYHEPRGVGAAHSDFCDHGLAVTGALLFGPLDEILPRPLCKIRHVRVLDNNTGSDLEYVDVLDRIIAHINDGYEFMNISVGPDISIADDEITAWTAEIDSRLAGGRIFAAVAAGNDGERDSTGGLDRIQPPSDGVNVVCVGASDTQDASWNRASYSCRGPGRSPGLVKPDGVSFGGSQRQPFKVLGRNGTICDTQGTSFASPYALRSAVLVRTQLGNQISALAIRALMIHRADRHDNALNEVGWGRFEVDPGLLITCDDREALVIYEGELPIGQELRVFVPIPQEPLRGLVTLTATLVIAPDVDPAFPGAYTRSGLEVFFRPDSRKHRLYEDGTTSKNPVTAPFFSDANLYGASESTLREEACKWETCRKHSRTFQAHSLHEPYFDIRYHQRREGHPAEDDRPVRYAFVISVESEKIPDLYNRVLRNYANILVPLRPRLRIPVTLRS